MTLLAIDTSASLCAAAIFDGDAELGRETLDIGKGHAERLMAVIGAALRKSNVTYPDLTRIAVAVGPGSFTGIRVGVATARGLALALKIPAVGVGNLEAVAAEARRPGRAALAAFASSLGAIQAAVYDVSGALIHGPSIMAADAAAQLAVERHAIVAGSAAPLLAGIDPEIEIAGTAVTADIATYARLAAAKPADERPKPLYLREPDAKPQAGFILPRAAS